MWMLPAPSIQKMREVLNYDPKTGLWIWTKRTANCIRVGDVAGRVATCGHRQICVDGKYYFAHRLAFLWMIGEWPPNEVDHIDMNPQNNAWSNLRLAERWQNFGNQRAYANNKLGVKGVSVKKKSGRYGVQIQVLGKKKHVGYFDDLETASVAYGEAAKKYFGEFARAS